jgi:putative alpha-1,2-mannosidase
MTKLYFNNPNGLAGNEDCGQMSAWYVMNAMGFYSFCPGDLNYSIGKPMFAKVEIALTNGKKFTIITTNSGAENVYIQSAKLNGEALNSPFFSHHAIMNGGILEFEMGSIANKHLFN